MIRHMLRASAVAALMITVPMTGAAAQDSGPCINANHVDRTFVIPAGMHEAFPRTLERWRIGNNFDRTVAFQLRFNDTARYASTDPVNQLDWNKVMGLATPEHQQNSIRLGWRYAPDTDEVELGFYGYLGGARTYRYLTSVAIGAWTDVELGMSNGSMYAIANGAGHSESGNMRLRGFPPEVTWVMTTAYFGGDETPSHHVTIDVRGITADVDCIR